MTGLDLGTIVLIIVGIWYLGGAINTILAKAGRLAEREYESFDREQAFRLAKGKEDLKAKVEKFKAESKSTLTDEELDQFLNL